MAFEEGPFVQTACFCETVIQEPTGVFSLIRIVDTINQSVVGPDSPAEMPPISVQLKLVIMLKAGRARGRWDLRLVPELPTGESKEPLIFSLNFEGEEKGTNLILDFTFTLEHEGLYWINVYLDDDKLTALPLKAKYSRQVTPQNKPPA